MSAALDTSRFGRAYHLLATCASTNDEVATRAREADAPEGLAIVAETQTGGRGRQGRAWHSPPGENLYLSLLLRPHMPPAMVPPLTLMVGAVAAEVLSGAGIEARLKWPNDVLVPTAAGLRKVAGILTEMASERDRTRHVVVGIGINVNSRQFPPELAARATSLALVNGRPFDRGALLAAFLNSFEPTYDRFLAEGPSDAIERWRAHALLGQRCRSERDGEILEGTTVDVDDAGALLLRDEHGHVHRVFSGEILY